MGIPEHFSSNFWKLHAGKFLETICWEIFGTICWEMFRKYMLGNFLETTCWEIFWKLYAGNLLIETMFWEIRVDAGDFLMG